MPTGLPLVRLPADGELATGRGGAGPSTREGKAMTEPKALQFQPLKLSPQALAEAKRALQAQTKRQAKGYATLPSTGPAGENRGLKGSPERRRRARARLPPGPPALAGAGGLRTLRPEWGISCSDVGYTAELGLSAFAALVKEGLCS